MLKEIFRSVKKSFKVKRLTKEYLKHSITEQTSAFEALMSDRSDKRDLVLDELVDTSFNEPNNQPVIKKFKLNKEKLKEIVRKLEFFGGAQYVAGHYISVSSILYPQTLEFIVYKDRKAEVEKMRMVLRIMDYFKNRETGNIVEIDYK
jgi:hypothetical protein